MWRQISNPSILWCGLFLAVISGCAAPAIVSDITPLGDAGQDLYTAAWQEVLQSHVKPDGVDYRGLSQRMETLEQFTSMLSKLGPGSTPARFPNRQARLAYWMNAYNACVLQAVVQAGVPATMHDPTQIPFRERVRFRIDGRSRTLTNLREQVEAEAEGDARVWFCLSDAARGSPPLYNQAFTAERLDEQITEACRRAMADTHLVRVDHATHELMLGVPIIEHQEPLLAFIRVATGKAEADLLDAVISLAGSMRGQWFSHARGYPVKIIPFDPQLDQSDE